MNNSNYTTAYLSDGTFVRVPEKKYEVVPENGRVELLRGHAFTLAVFVGEICVGWISDKDLPN